MKIDTVIVGGRVFDGTGAPPMMVDVGIRDGRIVACAPFPRAEAEAIIDARGLDVCPGFIDPLAHSHFSLLGDPFATSKVAQGVTFEVEGENSGAAPVLPPARKWICAQAASAGVTVDWQTIDDYAARLAERGTAINVGVTVPMGLVRASVVGLARGRRLAASQFTRIAALAEQCLRGGGLHLTFHLAESPCCDFTPEEVARLSRLAAGQGAAARFHIRNEASRVLDAVDEVIEIGQATGVTVDILHLKVVGPSNWKLQDAVLSRIERARAAGVRVSANAYPYEAASLALQEIASDGATVEPAEFRRRLRGDRSFRRLVIKRIGGHAAENAWHLATYASAGEGAQVGESVASAASARRRSPISHVLRQLWEADDWVHCNCAWIGRENIERLLNTPWVAIASDGSARDPKSPASRAGAPHPRDYGTFPRVLRHALDTGDSRIVSDTIRRMTSLAAASAGAPERGQLARGSPADVVVYDPAEVRDLATFENPHRLAAGIRAVFVNGVAVLRDGQLTGALPGRFVRRSAPAEA